MSPLRLAVVGHVNTGKTSLISTLARRSDLSVGDGRTTVAVQEVEFRSEGRTLLYLVDTPGFELVSEITLELERARGARAEAGGRADDTELLEDFLQRARQAESSELELDLRALEAALSCDVILYVVDVTQPPLDRLRDEVALLVRTARPVVGVLNFTAERGTHEERWREVFRREKVHAQVAFDVMVADEQAEDELLKTIEAVLPLERRGALERLRRAHSGEALRQRALARRAIAELLLDAVTLRGRAPKGARDAKDRARAELERRVREREAEGLSAIGRAHGFVGDEVDAETRTPEEEILSNDLFDPQTWKREAPTALKLAAGGAATGLLVDGMVGGLSLGMGALIGGAAGLLTALTRRFLEVRARGDVLEAALHPDFAWVLLSRALTCHEQYAKRTHAHRDRIALAEEDRRPSGAEAERVVRLLTAAARDPRLEEGAEPAPRRRAETLAEIETELAGLVS